MAGQTTDMGSIARALLMFRLKTEFILAMKSKYIKCTFSFRMTH
jgi:hypothetical protein